MDVEARDTWISTFGSAGKGTLHTTTRDGGGGAEGFALLACSSPLCSAGARGVLVCNRLQVSNQVVCFGKFSFTVQESKGYESIPDSAT